MRPPPVRHPAARVSLRDYPLTWWQATLHNSDREWPPDRPPDEPAEIGFAHHCGQRPPRRSQILLRNPKADIDLLLLHLSLQNVWAVGLPYVGKLVGSLSRVCRQFRQILPDVHQPLAGENLVKRGAHVVKDSQPLHLSGRFRLLSEQFRNPASGP